MHKDDIKFDDDWILSHRGPKNHVDHRRPYNFFVEKERTAEGKVEEVATLFLTNRECSFRCLMCDLWKNTTDYKVPKGAIPNQIEWALDKMPSTKHIKLYNSGSFFDEQAIPKEDYVKIAEILSEFETILIESHPKLIDKKCLQFKDMVNAELQVSIGLEIADAEFLLNLNKRMTLRDFEQSVNFLTDHKINSRAFILLNPPFLMRHEGIRMAKQSIEYAFEVGVECCVVIPTRSGNGSMDWLEDNQYFSTPNIHDLEQVLEFGIKLNKGRIFADLWDLEMFSTCDKCFSEKKERLKMMNFHQMVLDKVDCSCS